MPITPQPAILQAIPQHARYVTYTLIPGANPRAALQALCGQIDGDKVVADLGLSLVTALGRSIDELRSFPEFSGQGIDIPSTPAALLLWLRGSDRGEIVNCHRGLDALLASTFNGIHVIDSFTYDGRARRDLTGYEDGTENPKGEKAVAALTTRNWTMRRSPPMSNARRRKILTPKPLSYGARCLGPKARAAAWCSRPSVRPSTPTKRS